MRNYLIPSIHALSLEVFSAKLQGGTVNLVPVCENGTTCTSVGYQCSGLRGVTNDVISPSGEVIGIGNTIDVTYFLEGASCNVTRCAVRVNDVELTCNPDECNDAQTCNGKTGVVINCHGSVDSCTNVQSVVVDCGNEVMDQCTGRLVVIP